MAIKFKDNSKIIKQQLEEAMMKAAREIGNRMETTAKKKAPVDSGNLRSHIYGEAGKDGKNIIARVGTNVEYAIHMEYGTGLYAENGKGRKTPWGYKDKKGKTVWTHGSRPHPFIRPARDEMKEKVSDITAKYLKGVGK